MATLITRTGARGVSHRVQQMTNGKRFGKTFKCLELAEQYKRELESNMFNVDSAGLIKMSKAITDYLAQHTGKDNSVNQRLALWTDELGNITASTVNKRIVIKVLDKLATDKSGATVNRYQAILSSVFNYLIDNDLALNNPCKGIKVRKETKGLERYLSESEYQKLMTAASDSKWDKLPLLLLLATTSGCRRSELIYLKWSDICFKNKTATLSDTKNGTPRIVPLTNAVVSELMKFRKAGDAYIFVSVSSGNYPYTAFDRVFKTALAIAGITGFRFHDLRHSAASFLALNDVPMVVIAEILGHSSIQTTQRYVHLSTGHKRQHLERTFNSFDVAQVAINN